MDADSRHPCDGGGASPGGERLTDIEAAIAGIWEELVGTAPTHPDHDWFELGGHSLAAMRLANRVHERFGVQLEATAVFDAPTLRSYAARVAEGLVGPAGSGTGAGRESGSVDAAKGVRATPAQAALWMLAQLPETGSSYNVAQAISIEGDIDPAALSDAVAALAERHDALRARFQSIDGEPHMVVEPHARLELLVDAPDAARGSPRSREEIDAIVTEFVEAPFDLGRAPLVRTKLVTMAEGRHLLLLAAHHIVTDGLSIGVITHDLAELYRARAEGRPLRLAALDSSFAEYVARHSGTIGDTRHDATVAYWRERLSGLEPLPLPFDRPRDRRASRAGDRVTWRIDRESVAALSELARRESATPFMGFLAVFAALLMRQCRHEDIAVGTPVAMRDGIASESLVGYCVNTLVLRNDLSGNPSFFELLRRASETVLGAFRHATVPFERLVAELAPAREPGVNPLFQVSFALDEAPGRHFRLGHADCSVEHLATRDVQFDLSLTLTESDCGLLASLEYASHLFDAAHVESMAAQFRRLLAGVLASPEAPVAELDILAREERNGLQYRGAIVAPSVVESTLTSLFEAQASRTPGATAVVDGEQAIDYGTLDARANRLARRLRAMGVGRDDRVALCMERGLEAIVAMLAIVKAGGAYVPIDPHHPPARSNMIIDDAQPRVLLAQAATSTGLRVPPSCQVLLVDVEAPSIESASSKALPRVNTPADLAYVLYTSGSTGRPKGVMVEHRNITNHARWFAAEFSVEAGEAALQRTTLAFDAAGVEIWPQLISGGSIVVANDEVARDPRAMLDLIRASNVKLLQAVPGQLTAMVDELARDATALPLRAVFVGGDVLSPQDALRWHELTGIALYNMYGPTEATIDAAFHRYDPETDRDGVPIGRPPANCFVRLLDERLQPVPPGTRGEIFIGGAGVARGYLERPDLDAERFIDDPMVEGGRLYRSGDDGRLRADGALEFLGRVDHQVKVRGYRIELGDVEAALVSAGARQAVVLAVPDPSGMLRLAGYVEPADVDLDALRSKLALSLPDYMHPAAIRVMDRLPTFTNGKLDRKALPAPEFGSADRVRRGPGNPLEKAIADVWTSLLGIDEIDIEDDFFALGGNSLLAARAVARISRALDIDLKLSALFEAPTVAALARRIAPSLTAPAVAGVADAHAPQSADATPDGGGAQAAPVAPDRDPAALDLPASASQQALWYVESLTGARSSYHIAEAYRIEGGIDPSILERALERLAQRHDVLRAHFESREGQLRLIIPASIPLPFAVRDAEDDPAAQADRIAGEPFDLGSGPLWRAALLHAPDGADWLVLVVHHIVSDGWSMGTLWRELGTAYSALKDGREPALPALGTAYADYAEWQKAFDAEEAREDSLDFWRGRLDGLEPIDLPLDRPRPAHRSFEGGQVEFRIDRPLADRLRALGQRHGATLYMVLLAAWHTVLARHSGQPDFAIGTPVAGRHREEFESLVGYFVNMLVIRTDASDGPSFVQLLEKVRAGVLDALDHQDIAFSQLVSELGAQRDPGINPLFQVSFALQNTPETPLAIAGATCVPRSLSARQAKFDLALSISETDGRLDATLEYASEIFDHARIERLVTHYARALEQFAENETVSIATIALAGDEEARLVEQWSRGPQPDYPAEESLGSLFEAQVRRNPDAIALSGPGGSMTYAELDARANRVANLLRDSGIGPGDLVALCAARDHPMLVALLGIVKAGAAYLPLDPSYPTDRLRLMVEDARPALLIRDDTIGKAIDEALAGIPTLCLSRDADRFEAASSAQPPASAGGAQPAYVMYTSGSTGKPKGTLVTHRGITRLVCNVSYIDLGPDDAFSQVSNVSFDAATFEIWGAWLNGGRLVSLPPETVLTGERLAAAIEEHGITTLFLTTALFNAHAAADPGIFGSLRNVVFGGEAGDPVSMRRVLESGKAPARLINAYGPTETTTYATTWTSPRDPGELAAETVLGVPIGRPIDNTSCHVLDARGQPQPIGVVGELYIGGPGVALGYLERPDLTAERFVPDPHGTADARLYRTGDLVRWRDDGTLLYVGRNDQQVKIRGFRIELGEIEAALYECDGVREAAVVVDDHPSLGKRVVAFVVPEAGVSFEDPSELRRDLRARLPEFMVPALVRVAEALPVTGNGKLDRKALLAALRETQSGGAGAGAPTADSRRGLDAVASKLLGIWRDILRRPDLGPDDHFFDSGGHSLLALRMLGEVEREFGRVLRVASLFDAPTVREFAALLRGREPRALQGCAVTVQPGDGRPPLFFVSGYGGEIVMFRDLARELGEGQSLVVLDTTAFRAEELEGLELPAVAARMIEDMRRIQPDGPYHLCGFSLGGKFVYEMARQLRAAGETVDLLALLDCFAPGYPPPRPLGKRLAMHLRALTTGDLRSRIRYVTDRIAWMRSLGAERNLFENSPELADMAIARAMNESANAMMAIWERHEPDRYDGPMLVVRAAIREDLAGVIDDDPQLGWSSLVDGPIRVRDLESTHNDMLAAEHADALAGILLEYLQAGPPIPAGDEARTLPATSGRPLDEMSG